MQNEKLTKECMNTLSELLKVIKLLVEILEIMTMENYKYAEELKHLILENKSLLTKVKSIE